MNRVYNGKQTIIPADKWDAFKLSFTTLDDRTISFVNRMSHVSKFKSAFLPVLCFFVALYFAGHLSLQLQYLEKPLLVVLLLLTVLTVFTTGGKFMSWVTLKLYHATHKKFLLPTFYFWFFVLVSGVGLAFLTAMAVIFGGLVIALILAAWFMIASGRNQRIIIIR